MSRSTSGAGQASAADLEIAHFWAAGDGQAMLEETLENFHARHADVRVAEESYANHGLAIKSRILQENPPDLFVEWPGKNLDPYLEAGALRDLTEFWEDSNLASSYIEGPVDLATFDGKVRAIPVDIHRMNNLFYNVELAEEAGVDPTRIGDPRDFLEVLRQCEDAGVVGLQQPMKNPSTVLQLFSGILIGQFGADTWGDIADGNARQYESQIRETVELLTEYADLASEDANFLDMVGANERFMTDDSVFFYQGDWVAGSYEEREGFDYGEEWDHVVFPGTEGVYRLGVDSFVASSTPLNEEALHTFLSYVSSPDALEVLNRMKGSIPPRKDVSLDRYPRFLQEQYEDFKVARDFPAGHALDVTPEAFVEAKAAASNWMADRDLDRATKEFVDAYQA